MLNNKEFNFKFRTNCLKNNFICFKKNKIYLFLLLISFLLNEQFILRIYELDNKIIEKEKSDINTFFKNHKYNIYCNYIPIFCASLLYSDKRNKTDIEIVTSLNKLPENIFKSIEYLRNIYNSSTIKIKNNYYKIKNNYAILNNKITRKNSIRFLVEPDIKNEYIFIGDIDIIYLVENYYDNYLIDMFNRKSCYSNIVRKNTRRLSGIHFSKWFCLYPILLNKNIDLMINDEELLLIRLKELQIEIDYNTTYRPIFGIHMSVGRNSVVDKKSNLTWVAEGKKVLWIKFKKTEIFRYIYSLLDKFVIDKINKLEEFYEKNE